MFGRLAAKPCMSWMHWLWPQIWHLFWIMQLCHTVNSMSTVADTVLFLITPSTILFYIKKWDRRPPCLSTMHGVACGTDNQVSVAVGPRLLILVNAISVVTHKAFVFHHAAVSAHPLCQPASLSPGIIYHRSTEHMRHSLSSLSSSSLVTLPVPAI